MQEKNSTIVIESKTKLLDLRLGELLSYRDLILLFVKRKVSIWGNFRIAFWIFQVSIIVIPAVLANVALVPIVVIEPTQWHNLATLDALPHCLFLFHRNLY